MRERYEEWDQQSYRGKVSTIISRSEVRQVMERRKSRCTWEGKTWDYILFWKCSVPNWFVTPGGRALCRLKARGSGLVVQLNWDGVGVVRRAEEKYQDGTLVAGRIKKDRQAAPNSTSMHISNILLSFKASSRRTTIHTRPKYTSNVF